jgi:two-component system phosphate regulon response regulator PhoB
MSAGKWRVLIADDDPSIRTLIITVLRMGPYELTDCNDAEGALLAIERELPFDVIICDFMLPGISGIDLIERIRAHARAHETPILLMSGHATAAMEVRAKAAGANLFLNKPFTVSQLRTAVRALLPLGDAHSATGA